MGASDERKEPRAPLSRQAVSHPESPMNLPTSLAAFTMSSHDSAIKASIGEAEKPTRADPRTIEIPPQGDGTPTNGGARSASAAGDAREMDARPSVGI